jgi:hypothetical protein
MVNDDETLENGGEPHDIPDDGKKKAPPTWGLTTRFGTGQGQPSSDAKKAGWAKKRRSQELARYLLGMEFVGKSEAFRAKIAEYFGMDAETMAGATNEAVIMMKQIGMAIEGGDMQAAQLIMERAYGKPKEFVDFGAGDNVPQLNITVLGASNGAPEIKTDEDDSTTNIQSNNGNDTPTIE